MSVHGVGDVFRIEGRFNTEKYLELLQNSFLPSLRARNHPFPPGPIIFVQDRCPVHTARLVQDWFARQDQLKLLEWPSRGCDCNPIEHLWATIANSWNQEGERNPDELLDHINREWEALRARPQLANNLVQSMPRRLQEVIEKEGGWTRY